MAQPIPIAKNVQDFLQRYALIPNQTSYNIDTDATIRVECGHCSHKFGMQTKQVTSMMHTSISTSEHTFTFCPRCRHTSKFITSHIALRKDILAKVGIIVPKDIHPAVGPNNMLDVEYNRHKVAATIQIRAFDLAYGSINDLRQRMNGGNTVPPKIVRTAPKVTEFVAPPPVELFDVTKSTAVLHQIAKQYLEGIGAGEVIDIGWEDVVLLQRTNEVIAFTIGKFTDSDITALMDDVRHAGLGELLEHNVVDVRDVVSIIEQRQLVSGKIIEKEIATTVATTRTKVDTSPITISNGTKIVRKRTKTQVPAILSTKKSENGCDDLPFSQDIVKRS